MKKYFADYPLEERKALWEKYLPRVQNEFDDYNYGIARDSFAETFPDYMNMTEFEGVPFDPKDRSHVALANMFGWDDSYWDDWENDYSDTESLEKTGAYKMESFETMFRKAKGYDMREEADTSDYEPVDEKKEAQDKQRRAVGDKLTDEDGNTRLKHKANVPALENYDQDIRAPQGEVHDADKLKATKKSAGFREMVARNCFEKTGRIPDVEFMDTYEVKKAADEADFNEMAEGYANNIAKPETADDYFQEQSARHVADKMAQKPARKDLSRLINKEKTDLQTVMDEYEDDNPALEAMSSIAGDNARAKLDANAPENPGEYAKMMSGMSDYARQAISNLLLNELKIPNSDAQRYIESFMDGFDDSKHDWNRRKKAVPYDHF